MRTCGCALQMSAFRSKADMPFLRCECPLLTQSGHQDARPTLPRCQFYRYDEQSCASGVTMRRRAFIKLFGGAAATWPVAARAQQPAIPVIGYLDSRSPDAAENRLRGFHQGLKDA